MAGKARYRTAERVAVGTFTGVVPSTVYQVRLGGTTTGG
jgi:hypothetical protein